MRLNDDPCTSGATQRNPWISVAPNGRVDAIFYDNRDDGTDPRDSYGVRYANSTDGGLSFGPNARVSDVDFEAATFFTPQPQGFQSNEFDQVNGIDSTNTGAVGAWGDPRQAPSSLSTRSDVFSVGIGFAEPGPRSEPGPDPPRGGTTPPSRVQANLVRPRVTARQRRGRISVRVAGLLTNVQGRPCAGRVAMGVRSGGRRRARRAVKVNTRCRYATTLSLRARLLPKRLRPRRRRLLVRVSTRYGGTSQLLPDRSPSVLRRVIR